MLSLTSVFNNNVRLIPIKIISDDTLLFKESNTVNILDNTNVRILNAYNDLFHALALGDVSEAIERIGVALRATYDNTRTMINLFNRLTEETNNSIRRNNEQERCLGTCTEST